MSDKKRLRELRKELGLTQAQFAQGISVSTGYIARLEMGNSEVNDRIIKLVCTTYNASEHWLRNGTGEMFDGQTAVKVNLALSYFEKLNPAFQDYVLAQLENLLVLQQRDK